MKKSIINACILGLGLLSMTACSDPMDEITSLIVGRNFSPVNFETKDITKESASFHWTAVSGATSYELQIFADSDLDFSGEPTFVFKNISKDDIPYAVSGLMYDTQYSARVMAVDDNDATRNSKWSEVSFRTNAQQIFKSVSNSDIADRSVVMNWPAGEEVTTIYAVASETGDTITTKQLTETEIAAGKAIVDGLQPETKYDVYLYNGSKKRGTKTFKTIADLNGAIVVRPGDDFASLIKNAEAGSVFALMPDTFKIMSEDETGTSAVAISKSIEIKGIYPTAAPVIQGRFEINDGASVSIDNVVLDGSANVSTDQAFNFKTADATYGKVVIKNSEIKNFGKGVFYVNVACTINELTFKNCLIHDIECDGGDMFDCRKGRIDNLNLLESTIYNSAASRDFIRMDDASALGGAPVITVNKCTIDGASNKAKRLLYVRYIGNAINWTNNIVSNTGAVWSNQSKTGVPTFQNNVYFNCAKLNVADVEGKTNMFADEAGKEANPEYKNAAKGDFTIGNESVKKLGVGDPRW